MSIQGQPITITYTAYNRATNALVSGDQANHTLKLVTDGVETALAIVATPLSDGEYAVSLTGVQNAGATMAVTGSSSTANVSIVPCKWLNEIPATGGGPLAYSIVVTSDGTTPLVGAEVRLVSGSTSAQATTDAGGIAAFGLRAGAWKVLATLDGYSYAPSTVNVTADGQTVITMTATSITPSADAGQTIAYQTTRDGSGQAVGSVAVTFSLLDPQSQTDAWSRRNINATSDVNGLLQVPLRKGTKYRARMDRGDWVEFTTGTDTTYALPELLGIEGS